MKFMPTPNRLTKARASPIYYTPKSYEARLLNPYRSRNEVKPSPSRLTKALARPVSCSLSARKGYGKCYPRTHI